MTPLYPPPVGSNSVDQSSHSLTIAARELFNDLDKNVKPVAPIRFLAEE
ncbi:deubiquitinating enzyme [Orobanche gracilis]